MILERSALLGVSCERGTRCSIVVNSTFDKRPADHSPQSPCLSILFSSFSRPFSPGVHGDSLTVLQAPEFVSFQKGDWPVSGEKIPDLVALTMGFSIQEVHRDANFTCPVLLFIRQNSVKSNLRGGTLFFFFFALSFACRILPGRVFRLVRCSSVLGPTYWSWSEVWIA